MTVHDLERHRAERAALDRILDRLWVLHDCGDEHWVADGTRTVCGLCLDIEVARDWFLKKKARSQGSSRSTPRK